ncbi:AAA family ATPase [Rhodobacter sp. KR11]|uniref:ParA family protein n=1 Tax=Rhodobacter sp. KR11 TaxID=2974588 RepID=UPI002222B67E|nr:AAA family ATPase [Rhodobacter sp. KR11]MCW1918067.1 AAA family ATPase [Rhodobacter sp. KR11]
MKILACYSNKGGVGKTATSVNLAHAFATMGLRVLLCDLDPQGASGFYFRVKPSKKLTEARFFEDVARLTDAIRASDYEGLDILPANMGFRDFDVFLSRMRDKRSRLKKALTAVQGDYDLILLDCPPNISTLSENVFRAADAIVVPVIPTTLSERTFEHLVDFFDTHDLPKSKLLGVFSMVQTSKSLHGDTMKSLTSAHKKRFLRAWIPFASDIERMGVHRAPLLATAPKGVASKAYRALAAEVLERMGLAK